MPRAPKHCGINGCTAIVPVGTRCQEHSNGWKNSPRTASSQATSGTHTTAWQKLRADILNKDNHTCQIRTPGICTGVATVVDKTTPASQRPDLAHEPRNLRAACRPCNDHKARTTDRL